ncbi:hypothetical protein CYMTET_56824 [Cymbomonas tetramitiformis]|uniref:Uncharacterized protein n=1 Tax=Cymbomonas tetramitiformis TaxID=36881 RepID=A0AAE0BBE7_9CHLO|nr:hypothetical protein CYMTET_56824 [Cymbomonas tetramitiformis]
MVKNKAPIAICKDKVEFRKGAEETAKSSRNQCNGQRAASCVRAFQKRNSNIKDAVAHACDSTTVFVYKEFGAHDFTVENAVGFLAGDLKFVYSKSLGEPNSPTFLSNRAAVLEAIEKVERLLVKVIRECGYTVSSIRIQNQNDKDVSLQLHIDWSCEYNESDEWAMHEQAACAQIISLDKADGIASVADDSDDSDNLSDDTTWFKSMCSLGLEKTHA